MKIQTTIVLALGFVFLLLVSASAGAQQGYRQTRQQAIQRGATATHAPRAIFVTCGGNRYELSCSTGSTRGLTIFGSEGNDNILLVCDLGELGDEEEAGNYFCDESIGRLTVFVREMCSSATELYFNGFGGNDVVNARSLCSDITLVRLEGGQGNDVLVGSGNDDEIFGGAGNDNIWGEAGDDVIEGGNGNDRIDGGGGSDHISGGNGNDDIVGGPDEGMPFDGSDVIRGDNGNDCIDGGGRNDEELRGGNGNDMIKGGVGSILIGDSGRDYLEVVQPESCPVDSFSMAQLYGGEGDDRLSDSMCADYMMGGRGNNIIYALAETPSDIARQIDDVTSGPGDEIYVNSWDIIRGGVVGVDVTYGDNCEEIRCDNRTLFQCRSPSYTP